MTKKRQKKPDTRDRGDHYDKETPDHASPDSRCHIIPNPSASQNPSASKNKNSAYKNKNKTRRDNISQKKPRSTTSLTQLPSNRFTQGRVGTAGSNSIGAINLHTGRADPLADMAGVINHSMPHARPPPRPPVHARPHVQEHQERHHESDDDEDEEDDQDMMDGTPSHSRVAGSEAGESHASSLPLIIRRGYKLGKTEYHREAIRIFWQNMDDAWPTYLDIPESVMTQMFERFRTSYRWDPAHEQHIFQGFKNTISFRYRDRMNGARKQSLAKARRAGEKVGVNPADHFAILRNHHPRLVPDKVWRDLCNIWDTPEWKKISETGSKNRNSKDSTGRTSRHTGGSIGFDEHRERLALKYGNEPTWLDVYMQTHLTKESKVKWFQGERENLQFVSQHSSDAFNKYREMLEERYGVDASVHVVDDPALWRQCQLQSGAVIRPGRIFGVGASDIDYLMTGTCSSGSTSGLQSQQEVEKLREQLNTMQESIQERETQFQVEMQNEVKRQMEERDAQVQEKMREREAQMKAEMQAQVKEQMQAQVKEQMQEREAILKAQMEAQMKQQIQRELAVFMKNCK